MSLFVDDAFKESKKYGFDKNGRTERNVNGDTCIIYEFSMQPESKNSFECDVRVIVQRGTIAPHVMVVESPGLTIEFPLLYNPKTDEIISILKNFRDLFNLNEGKNTEKFMNNAKFINDEIDKFNKEHFDPSNY